jgi:hypothetical protein
MNIVINILLSILGSETIKVIAKRATTALLERTGTSIDNELSKAIMNDIANSNGNNVTISQISKIVKGL